jgi:lipopolysaccharide transport system ATP-binding protein
MRRREIDQKFDEIVAFSEVEEFLDTPVKFYSSGMRMRLAFSVAAHLEPEILFIDEVLAVGDMAFQKKSIAKMEDVIRSGHIVLFVSHNMAVVRSLCKKGLYLEHGEVKYFGEMNETVNAYLNTNGVENFAATEAKPDLKKTVQITKVEIAGLNKTTGSFPNDKPLKIKIRVEVRKAVYQTGLSLTILDNEFNPVLTSYDFDKNEKTLQQRKIGTYNYILKIPPMLAPSNYRLTVEALELGKRKKLDQNRTSVLDSFENICPFEIYDNGSSRSRINVPSKGALSLPIKWEIG